MGQVPYNDLVTSHLKRILTQSEVYQFDNSAIITVIITVMPTRSS